MAAEFRVLLGKNVYCCVYKVTEFVNVSFRRFVSYEGNEKTYPPKDGISLSLTQYGVLLLEAGTILNVLRGGRALRNGKVYEKDLGFGKTLSVWYATTFADSVGPFTVEIRGVKANRPVNVVLSESQFRTWAKNRKEIGVAIDRLAGELDKSQNVIPEPERKISVLDLLVNGGGDETKSENEKTNDGDEELIDVDMIMDVGINSIGCADCSGKRLYEILCGLYLYKVVSKNFYCIGCINNSKSQGAHDCNEERKSGRMECMMYFEADKLYLKVEPIRNVFNLFVAILPIKDDLTRSSRLWESEYLCTDAGINEIRGICLEYLKCKRIKDSFEIDAKAVLALYELFM